MIINNNYYANVGRISSQKKADLPKKTETGQIGSFEEILKSKTEEKQWHFKTCKRKAWEQGN